MEKAKNIINDFNLPIDADSLCIKEEGFIDFKASYNTLEWIKSIFQIATPDHESWEWQEISKGIFYQGGTFPQMSVWNNFFLTLREQLIEEKDKEFPGLIKALEENENFSKGHNSEVLKGWRVEPFRAIAIGDTNRSWQKPLVWVIGVSKDGDILPASQVVPKTTAGPIGDNVYRDEHAIAKQYQESIKSLLTT